MCTQYNICARDISCTFRNERNDIKTAAKDKDIILMYTDMNEPSSVAIVRLPWALAILFRPHKLPPSQFKGL